jgi:hypothetical protein
MDEQTNDEPESIWKEAIVAFSKYIYIHIYISPNISLDGINVTRMKLEKAGAKVECREPNPRQSAQQARTHQTRLHSVTASRPWVFALYSYKFNYRNWSPGRKVTSYCDIAFPLMAHWMFPPSNIDTIIFSTRALYGFWWWRELFSQSSKDHTTRNQNSHDMNDGRTAVFFMTVISKRLRGGRK